MKIVAENHAESFGVRSLSTDAFLAAVIGEHLRAHLEDGAALPDRFLILAKTLDRNEDEDEGAGLV